MILFLFSYRMSLSKQKCQTKEEITWQFAREMSVTKWQCFLKCFTWFMWLLAFSMKFLLYDNFVVCISPSKGILMWILISIAESLAWRWNDVVTKRKNKLMWKLRSKFLSCVNVNRSAVHSSRSLWKLPNNFWKSLWHDCFPSCKMYPFYTLIIRLDETHFSKHFSNDWERWRKRGARPQMTTLQTSVCVCRVREL